jgi:hypothetical protein
MFLTVCSLLLNVVEGYHNFMPDQIHLLPIANMYFLTTLMVIGGFVSIYKTHQNVQFSITGDEKDVFRENFKDILQ